ncbi:hypothetical protein CEUSTIGMA_g8382.t1 [Chlamydomonas eustigma]|uniref:Protein kinase domain-containing protein n=1 Tax=Chlamydomonas eustigma TaxID=1157962 RepID=A0A250XCY1_9CHLO|nr:hypothetical protein CEUSTIGMA_g8382.t1 [Chlamydomonas eustigma]|eukprot:GAX80947.1 hypothetical protein CEUSTIGMA_g8382.t1 [Chlamydomonas eustigma]
MDPLADQFDVVDSIQRYEKLYRIGEGTYGIVYKARDRENDEIVALKKVRFDHAKDGVPVTSIRELRVLQSVNHPNIVRLKKVVTGTKAESIFLVFEYCEHDVGRLLDSLNSSFTLSEIKCLLKQLLEALVYLHDRWVMHRWVMMHRDIKMSNLLYNSRGQLKLCDFGLARYFAHYPSAMTPRVVTLWYRAPEVLLGTEIYDEAIDMWSVGCVLGELLKSEPLFPAENEMECLRMQCNLLGSPNTKTWPGLQGILATSNLKPPEQPLCSNLRQTFRHLSDEGLDLLSGLLSFDPETRFTARQAIRHPFFNERPLPKACEDMPTFPSSHNHNPENNEHFSQKRRRHGLLGEKAVGGGSESSAGRGIKGLMVSSKALVQQQGGCSSRSSHRSSHFPALDARREETQRRFGEAFGGP